MSQQQPLTREEIEEFIEEQKERIFEERYTLRWLLRDYRGIGGGVQ